MGNWTVNAEQRMVLRLTDLAAAVVDEDSLNFKAKSPSDILCRIFEQHYEKSNASIGRMLLRKEEELTELLGVVNMPSIGALCRSEKEALLRLQDAAEKGDNPVPIRIQNKTLEKLLDCEDLEGAYYNRPTAYMVAVIEDYCRLPAYQREKVYFADRFALMEAAISQQRQLRITVGSGRAFLVHPCYMQTDKLAKGWYLAGYSRQPGEPLSSKRTASYRISSLQDVRMLSDKASVTAQLRRDLLDKIKQQGIQFLVQEPCRILVRMHEQGPSRYAAISTMRPPCHQRNGDVWEFYCSPLQAMWYFTRMASDCEILKPDSLREAMMEYLKTAIEKYEK